ncbi:MAG: tetratricopeptide repeat protein [Planctomycetes bacterium]|nr:tetratricopeptide repeat protein [Planctomycetota bacterium]
MPKPVPLPEATRLPKQVNDKGLTIPVDVPTHPEIPRPDFPGLAESIKREVIAAYVDAAKNPENADMVGELGMIYLRLSSAGDAIKCFSRAARLDPSSFRWKYLLALAHAEAFDVPAAVAALKEAATIDPNYHAVHVRLGDLLFRQDPKAACEAYRKAADMVPQDSQAWYGLGECALKSGNKREALEHYKKAAVLAPNFAKANRMVATLLREEGDRKQAEIHDAVAAQGGLAPVIRDPIYLDYLGRIARGDALVSMMKQLVETGQLEIAGSILERTLKWEPQNWEFHEQLGIVRWKQNRFEEAAKELRIVLDENFSHSTVRGILAECLLELGDYREAEQVFNDVLIRNANDVETLPRYGEFLLRVNRASEARAVYEKLNVLQRGTPQHVIDFIVSIICEGNYEDAAGRIKTLHQGVRDIVDVIMARLATIMADQAVARSRGVAKTCLGTKELSSLAAALETVGLADEAPKVRDYVTGIAKVAVALADSGNFNQAIRMLQRTIELDDGGRLRDALRSVFLRLAKRDGRVANAWLKDGLRHADDQPTLAICLSWILATSPEAGQRDGATAVRLAESACKSAAGEGSEYQDALAAAYAEVGRFDDAVKSARKAIEMAGNKPGASAIKARLAKYESRQAFHAAN